MINALYIIPCVIIAAAFTWGVLLLCCTCAVPILTYEDGVEIGKNLGVLEYLNKKYKEEVDAACRKLEIKMAVDQALKRKEMRV